MSLILGCSRQAVGFLDDHLKNCIICKTVCLMLSGRCPVCPVLSVTLVHCGQTVGWIEMKLGVEVGLGPSHIVLDGDPSLLPKRGTAPNFGPCLLWPKGWMDQDATCQGGMPRPRPHCIRWWPSSPFRKRAKHLSICLISQICTYRYWHSCGLKAE